MVKNPSTFCLHLKWHPIPYIAHYFRPEFYGPWSEVMHYIGNRVPFVTQALKYCIDFHINSTPTTVMSAPSFLLQGLHCLYPTILTFIQTFCYSINIQERVASDLRGVVYNSSPGIYEIARAFFSGCLAWNRTCAKRCQFHHPYVWLCGQIVRTLCWPGF